MGSQLTNPLAGPPRTGLGRVKIDRITIRLRPHRAQRWRFQPFAFIPLSIRGIIHASRLSSRDRSYEC